MKGQVFHHKDYNRERNWAWEPSEQASKGRRISPEDPEQDQRRRQPERGS